MMASDTVTEVSEGIPGDIISTTQKSEPEVNESLDPVEKDITDDLEKVDKEDNKDEKKKRDETFPVIQLKSQLVPMTAFMPRPKVDKSDLGGMDENSGLEYLVPLSQLFIFEKIKLIDGELCVDDAHDDSSDVKIPDDTELFGSKKASKNMMTIRNENYQIVYLVYCNTTAGRYRSFRYRMVDQYSKHVMTISKSLMLPFCGKMVCHLLL